MIIRAEQMKSFEETDNARFQDWMCRHIEEFFPDQSRAMGEAGVRGLVQYGIQRAGVYGITSKRDVCKYIDLMVVFGRDLDIDPRCSWAGDILRLPAEPEHRITALQNAAIDHLDRAR